MDREQIIERLLDKWRQELDEKDNEELLGDALDRVREEVIQAKVENYQEDLEDQDDEELLGRRTTLYLMACFRSSTTARDITNRKPPGAGIGSPERQ